MLPRCSNSIGLRTIQQHNGGPGGTRRRASPPVARRRWPSSCRQRTGESSEGQHASKGHCKMARHSKEATCTCIIFAILGQFAPFWAGMCRFGVFLAGLGIGCATPRHSKWPRALPLLPNMGAQLLAIGLHLGGLHTHKHHPNWAMAIIKVFKLRNGPAPQAPM